MDRRGLWACSIMKRADVGGDVHSGAYTSAVPAGSYVQAYSMGVAKSRFFVSGCDVFA